MGFFSSIGSFIKKNVTFHNLVKVAGTVVSMIPVVGGVVSSVIGNMQDQHDAGVAQREADAQQAQAQSIPTGLPAGSPPPLSQMAVAATAKGGATIGDILSGAGAGALIGAGNVLGGTNKAGEAGATLADSTMVAWVKLHKQALLMGAAGLFGLFFLLRPHGASPVKTRRY